MAAEVLATNVTVIRNGADHLTAAIGGLGISMVLSLVVTPVVYFLLTRNRVTLPEQSDL